MGYWTALPRVDVESVGAGGGSLTWTDERGMLRVGPTSAGAMPGPVCYGRGGTQAALTDALAVLGYIAPDNFLGGTMQLDRDGALQACTRLGEGLGLDAIEAAWGVREIAVAEMVKAVRARLSTHALAAAEHCLVSYGGCGALFAAEVARMAGLQRVLIPELASVLSAYGAATIDIRRERLTTLLLKLPGDAEVIDRTFAELREAVWQDLAADGVAEEHREVRFEADMRFFLQRWELTIAFPGEPVASDGGSQAEAIFREEYLRRFGAASTTTSGIVELVGIRAIGIGRMAGDGTAAPEAGECEPRNATPVGSRAVNLRRGLGAEQVTVYDGAGLEPGDTFAGPALVDASDTTIWVPQAMTARMDAGRTLTIEADS
jgi:N-methylhydantoinase A